MTCCPAAKLPTVAEDEQAGQWFLIEAMDQWDVLEWRPDIEATAYPSALVWGGGIWEGAVAAWQDYQAANRTSRLPDWRDRVFVVRCWEGGFEACRSPAQLRALPAEQRDRTGTMWQIVRADHPGDVWWMLQAEMSGEVRRGDRHGSLLSEDLGDFDTWQAAAAKVAEVRA